MSKVASVLARCDFQGALKDVAHRVDVPKAAFVRDHFHAVVTFLQPTASGFDAETLNEFCGRRVHLFGEDPCEIARTHCYALCQQRYCERFLPVFDPSIAVITQR